MKTKLHFLNSRFYALLLLLFSTGIFAQTLVNYPLNNNLNPDAGPDASITPTFLRYYEPPSTTPSTTTNHALGYLNYRNSGDYLQFNFNLPANDNVTLQVNAGTAVFLSAISGNIQIYAQIGAGPEILLQQQDLNAASSIFSWVDLDNVSFSLPISNPQAVAVPVKIRIVGNITSQSGLQINYFGINNISLVREITTISVRSTKANPQPSFITHNAGASVTFDTDFGNLLTNEESVDKTYRIANTGSETLKINSIQIDPNNVGFSIIGAVPTTINVGKTATFTVRFAPTNQGLKTAEVVIVANITPNNPFRFEVKGSGKSCNLTPIPIAEYGFEGAVPSNMPISTSSGTFKVVGGTAANPSPNIGSLYPNGNLYSSSSPTKSWYVRGNDTGAVTLEFGPMDVANQQEVSINFDLAAFGLTSGTNDSGVNSSDYIILSVYNPTTGSWSQEIRLNGANNSTRRKYGYGAGGVASGDYDGNETVEPSKTFTNNTTNYGAFKLNIPTSISQLSYRITAYTSRLSSGSNRDRNLWLIDNVHVDAGNAKAKTWTGAGWTGENTNRPGAREKAIFAANYNFTAPGETATLSVCECEVNDNSTLTILANRTLTVQNKIINHGNGDNFVIRTGGNLIQIEDDAVNTGSVTAERLVNDMDNVLATQMDYVYWSSPVTGQGLQTFSPGTPANKIFYYNEPNDLFKQATGDFEPGKGYAIRAETPIPGVTSSEVVNGSYNKIYKFRGVPNNGVIDIDVQKSPNTGATGTVEHGYNLIGNPYPSNMSFPEFQALNSSVIHNTAWFWTNNTYIKNQQGQGYSENNYAIWNGTGGVAATAPAGGTGNTITPNGTVAVGQGFIVQVKNLGMNQQLRFQNKNGINNSLRVSTAGTFYNKGGEQKDRFWLKLISKDSIVNSQLIGYVAGATNGYEKDYDAEIMGMSSNVFYSLLDDRKLQIQGKAAFDQEDKIVLGANFFKNETYTIALGEKEGVFANGQNIYLKDKETGIITNLSEGSYTFTANKGINEGRFEIIYKPETVLATDAIAKDELQVYRNGGDFVVVAKTKKIADLEVYDASGRLVYKTQPNDTKAIISSDRLNNGMYILKINQNGNITGKKILK